MNIKIEIETDNAAFEDYSELSRILKYLANKTHGYDATNFDALDGLPLTDINGNRVGKVTVTE